jgi:hypothetical protein
MDNIKTFLQAPKYLNGSNFLWGSHHPHCDRHNHHLIWIFNHPFCLGCTCMYSGIAIGCLTYPLINWISISIWLWIPIHLTLLIPTLFQPWVQRKSYKIFARTTLGFCISSYLISGLFQIKAPFELNPWVFRLAVLVAFILGIKLLTNIRKRKLNDPCQNCPLGVFPTCEWNLPRLLKHNPQKAIFKEANFW